MPSPQLFHKILRVAFFLLLCCAQGKPAGIPSQPSIAPLPEDGVDEGFVPVLRLEKTITASEGKVLATNRKKADFHTTLKKCKEVGRSIATPRNPGENDAILYFVKNFNTYTYLGIKDLIPSKFQFLDGTQLSYTDLNEPSGKGEEECVEMYTDGTWNDKKCNWNCLIVCQF
ncbi:LOW QUALITY PROTEIN: pulmonary surfactant-associated protein A-like [Ciconia maguari]